MLNIEQIKLIMIIQRDFMVQIDIIIFLFSLSKLCMLCGASATFLVNRMFLHIRAGGWIYIFIPVRGKIFLSFF